MGRRRVDSLGLGRLAEAEARAFLEARGYAIVGCNVHVGRDEIDLIVTRDDCLVFVEVRLRSLGALENPLASVSLAKQRRIIRGAERYLMEHPNAGHARSRFDVITVTFGPSGAKVEHFEAAFSA